jgi:glycine hydroxymethyltransferase
MILAREKYSKMLDSQIFPGIQGGPLMHTIAAKAVAFQEALQPTFQEYQKRIVTNSQGLAAELTQLGFRLVSGGTDNHLMLVDLSPKGLTGSVAEDILDRGGITVNKNTIPFDPQKPSITSGIRIGTPAVTTRGMGPENMETIAQFIHRCLEAGEDDQVLALLKKEVAEFCLFFPLHEQPQ